MEGTMQCDFIVDKTVWLRDKHGKIFHWPFDQTTHPKAFNSPDDPIDVPADESSTKLTGDVFQIDLPQGKIITHTNRNGRTGACVRCGLCCIGCMHLLVNKNGLGKPNGTLCKIYKTRLYEGYKGCILWPLEPIEITLEMSGICGMRFM